jgi:hypothetical protein
MKNYKEIEREGKRLIKYRLNVAGDKHMFCYKLNKIYYEFIKYRGEIVNINDMIISNGLIKGNKKKGKYFNKYFNSTLNEFYTIAS